MFKMTAGGKLLYTTEAQPGALLPQLGVDGRGKGGSKKGGVIQRIMAESCVVWQKPA